MQLHELKIKKKQKRGKRIGRGGKRGTHSGRGIKGQKTRAGRKMVPSIRQFIKKYPKLRGYRRRFKRGDFQILNIHILEKNFDEGSVVSPVTLIEKKLVRRIKGRIPNVKILGRGRLTKKLKIKGCVLSKKAEEKIKKIKGTIEP